jgi:hypothetical protein
MTENFTCAWNDFKKMLETRNILPTEEELELQRNYEEYTQWCRKWIVPPEVFSYEDYWRMAADIIKDNEKDN